MYMPNFLDGFDRLVAFDAETTGKRTPDAEFIRKQPFAWRAPGIIIEVGFVEMLRDGEAWRKADTPAELCCRKLKELSDRLDQFHASGKGQFVKWKSGLKNRRFPDYGEPAIVTAVLPSPIFDPSEVSSASPYFQEPLSIIIGTYREDDFLEFRVDGRRFEPFES